MTETETEKRRSGPLRTLLLRGALLLLCMTAAALLCLKIYLNSSHAPLLLSSLLTDYLHQPVRVSALDTDGGVITLRGLSLANPPDSVPGDLCWVDTLTVAPNWGELLGGRRSLRLLSISGLRIDLRRNSAGAWNFSPLQRLLASRKPSGAELFIQCLVVRDGTFGINGQRLGRLDLRLNDLSTRGSADARIELSFQDPGRNRYTLVGKVRPGPAPSLDLALSAPSIFPAGLAGMFGLKNALMLAKTRGALRVDAHLHAGRLGLRGSLDFDALPLSLVTKQKQRTSSVDGRVEFVADYDVSGDQARLESLVLRLNDRVAAHATGTLEGVRTVRRFSVDLAMPRVDLAQVAPFLLPEGERRKTVLAGSIGSSGIHLAGDARGGVSAVRGTFLLRDVSLRRDGRLLFSGVTTPLSLSRVASGFLARGRLSRQGGEEGALLSSLDIPFRILISKRLKLVGVRTPELSARVMGVSVSGSMGGEPGAANPLSASLRMTAPSFSQIAPLVETLGMKVESGSGSLSLEASGTGVRDFNAKALIMLSSVAGTRGAHSFVIRDGLLDARLVSKGGALSIVGASRLNGMELDGRRGDASFGYEVSDATLRIRDAVMSMNGTSLSVARIALQLPVKQSSDGVVRYPLSAQLSGGVIRQGESALDDLSATVRGDLVSTPSGRWLEGRGEFSAGNVSWQGKEVGAPRLRLSLSRLGGKGELGGTLLGGTLNGDISFDPFAAERGGAFRLGIMKARVAMIGGLLPRGENVLPIAGTLDGSVQGAYSRSDGLTCGFESTGSGIAASGSGKKTLFSDAGYRLSGSLSRERLKITTARVTVGRGFMITGTGDVVNPLSAQREGRIRFQAPSTPLNDIIDPFVNMLPRLIQEASVGGAVALEGNLALHGARKLLDGSLRLDRMLLDIPSQNLKVADISGTLPFSLDLSGKSSAEMRETANFTRKNYPLILEQFRNRVAGGQSITVGSVSFGPLRLGETSLRVSASDGITRITSLRSSLYEGALLGAGSFMLRDGVRFRSDLLINGLSLKLLCASIPAIKDYISGRVDGLVSLGSVGKGVAGLIGFSELWAREGNGEKMLVSKLFLQKLSGKNLSGFFFRNDRPFDQAKITAELAGGYLTFETLDISHTNLFGVRDLSVTIAPSQNRIALDHLFNSIKQAAARGKAATGTATPEQPATAEPEFKWEE
jgi:hypothetical protein